MLKGDCFSKVDLQQKVGHIL